MSGPDPFSTLVRGLPGVEQAVRIRRGMEVLATTPRPPVGLTPHEVIHQQDKLVVRWYGGAGRPPVVVVPSMINRAWICDLEPGRSLVEGLVKLGHPTYLVDWGVPGAEDADEDVGYVLLTLLHRSIERIRRHAHAEKVHLLGYCMGGTLTAMYAALRPAQVGALVTLNAPIRFADGGRFADFVKPDHFDVDRALDVDGLVPVEVMQPAFKLLDPMGNLSKYLAIEEASHDPAKLARVMAREKWLEENVPMAGAFAREFIRNAYQEDRLVNGGWVVRGETVDLRRIAAPTLVVACARDFITPPAAAAALAQHVGGPSRVEVLDTGHIGVVVGAEGPRTFYPLLDRFFREVAP